MTRFPEDPEYFTAIQNPEHALSDPALKSWRPSVKRDNLPMVWSGGYALIFRMRDPSGTTSALRCFKKPLRGLFDRYKAYQAFYQACATPLRDALVSSRFEENGILVNGVHYPIVTMPWVKGDNLNEWTQAHLKQPAALASLRQTFSFMVSDMERSGFVHGDLQHGNILVRGGRPVLVDYDTVIPPGATHLDFSILGLPGFQHPRFCLGDDPRLLDRFPSLVIHTALEVLELLPELGHPDVNPGAFKDALLFHDEDLRDPASSDLFRAIRGHANLRRRADALASYARGPVSALPTLESFLRDTLRPLPSIEPTLGPKESGALDAIYAALSAQARKPVKGKAPAKPTGAIKSPKAPRARPPASPQTVKAKPPVRSTPVARPPVPVFPALSSPAPLPKAKSLGVTQSVWTPTPCPSAVSQVQPPPVPLALSPLLPKPPTAHSPPLRPLPPPPVITLKAEGSVFRWKATKTFVLLGLLGGSAVGLPAVWSSMQAPPPPDNRSHYLVQPPSPKPAPVAPPVVAPLPEETPVSEETSPVEEATAAEGTAASEETSVQVGEEPEPIGVKAPAPSLAELLKPRPAYQPPPTRKRRIREMTPEEIRSHLAPIRKVAVEDLLEEAQSLKDHIRSLETGMERLNRLPVSMSLELKDRSGSVRVVPPHVVVAEMRTERALAQARLQNLWLPLRRLDELSLDGVNHPDYLSASLRTQWNMPARAKRMIDELPW